MEIFLNCLCAGRDWKSDRAGWKLFFAGKVVGADAVIASRLTPTLIVPRLRVGMPQWTLCVRFGRDAQRPGLHSHAERGNDHVKGRRAPPSPR
nr:hypothetical protein FEE99_11710 [Pseudomonas sp. ef1]